MSYILFSETSSGNFNRALWNVGGSTAADQWGWGAGRYQAVAGSLFDENVIVAAIQADLGNYATTGYEIDNKYSAIYDLSGGLNSELVTRLASGDVLNSGSSVTKLDTVFSNFSGGVLSVGVLGSSFGQFKNVEIELNNADLDTAYEGVATQNFTDARISIGDAASFNAVGGTAFGLRDDFSVDLISAKRGEVKAIYANQGVDVNIKTWADSVWEQNSFNNAGSAFSDSFTIEYGLIARAGALTTAVTAGDYAGKNLYNGSATVLFTKLNAGNDSYDATNGAKVVAGALDESASLQTTDYVWGGSGNDTIKTGGGNDILFGDWGIYRIPGSQTIDGYQRDIGVSGDDAGPAKITLGGDNTAEVWLASEIVTKIWASASVPSNFYKEVTQANDSAWNFFKVPETYFNNESTGIGVFASGGTLSSDSNTDVTRNPQITPLRQEVLGLDFAQKLTAFSANIGSLYQDDAVYNGTSAATQAATTGDQTEVGYVDILSGGVKIGTLVFAGNGKLLVTTGTLLDTNADADNIPDNGSGIVATGTGSISGVLAGKAFSASITGYGDLNPGYPAPGNGQVTVDFGFTGGNGEFDALQFKAWGISPVSTNPSIVGDYLLQGITVTTKPTAGNDYLDGGEGNDYLAGGGDTGVLVINGGVASVTDGDTIIGGAGNDTVVWNAGDGVDVVFGHVIGTDKIIFDTASNTAGVVQAVTYNGQASTFIHDVGDTTHGIIAVGVTLATYNIVWA